MPNFVLRAAAERHRLVASTLTDPNDRAIINRYADEVEALQRREVTPSTLLAIDNIALKQWFFADKLSRIYIPETTLPFNDLLGALDKV